MDRISIETLLKREDEAPRRSRPKTIAGRGCGEQGGFPLEGSTVQATGIGGGGCLAGARR